MVMVATCSVPGCGNPYEARGLCRNHYYRLRKHGDPLAGRTSPGEPMRWVTEVAAKYEADDCLIWPFGGGTYGALWIDGRQDKAHRVICEMIHGAPTSDRSEVAHSCGKGHEGCVNPRHLRWATRSENLMDRVEHGTSGRGEDNSHAKLTEDDVMFIRANAGGMSQGKLAERFGVSRKTIGGIVQGKRWAWLDGRASEALRGVR